MRTYLVNPVAYATLGLYACGFTSKAKDEPSPPDDLHIPAPETGNAGWTDTAYADFAKTGAQFDGSLATPWNTIEPHAYVEGGWIVRASPESNLAGFAGNEHSLKWDKLPKEAHTSINRGFISDFEEGYPDTLVEFTPDFTLWAEGEILLEAGQNPFELRCDDYCTVHMALDSNGFREVLAANGGIRPAPATIDTKKVASSTKRWVPIRIAMRDDGGTAHLNFSSNNSAINPDRMRFLATAISGATAIGFERVVESEMRTWVRQGARLWQTELAKLNVKAGDSPDGIGLFNVVNNTMVPLSKWRVLWHGQLRIEEPGDYTFQVTSSDRRMFSFDGHERFDEETQRGGGNDVSTVTIEDVHPGWHDFEFSWINVNSAAAIDIRMTGGGLVGQRIPPSMLRPTPTQRTDENTHLSIAPETAFVSAPRMFDTPVTVKRLHWTMGIKGDIAMHIRACTGPCADDAPWTEVPNSGDEVNLTGTHVQYKAVLFSDNVEIPVLTSVTVEADK